MNSSSLADGHSQEVASLMVCSTREVEQDFERTMQQAPPQIVGQGLAAAFRSEANAFFGQMLAHLFGQSNPEQRATVLNHLLSVATERSNTSAEAWSPIPAEETARVLPDAVEDLANETARRNPGIIDWMGDFYSGYPALVKTLGAGALALVLANVAQRLAVMNRRSS